MRRTGEWALAVAAVLLGAGAARAEVDIRQSVDRTLVGTEDTFRLTIVVNDPPPDSEINFPVTQDFEILSRSQSSQTSMAMGSGGSRIRHTQRFILVMRAVRAGSLTLPPSVLRLESGESHRTESILMEVRKGKLHAGSAQRPPSPFSAFDDLADDFFDFPGAEIPRSDSDLFLRTVVDKEEVYLGEQVTLSIYIFARMDVSSVESVVMPKLEGFWSEDVKDASLLTAERRMVNGVPYQAYLLGRRVLFPVKTGTLTIQPVEADVTTGMLFAGHRLHRKSNSLELGVKPLPPGAPPGFSPSNIGNWRLTTDASQTQVELGEPVQVRVVLEGTGNLRAVTVPPLTAPRGVKVYEPTVIEKLALQGGKLGGQRTIEYLVVPQQTGTFTLPGVPFASFNPELGRYERTDTPALSLTVVPSSGGQTGTPGVTAPGDKNKLEATTGMRPLRHRAELAPQGDPVWKRPFFLPALALPAGAWAALLLSLALRRGLQREDEESVRRRKAKAARTHLAGAMKLLESGSAEAFYAEVDRALRSFLEARLGAPVVGLTREQLLEKLREMGADEARRERVRTVLEACDAGRFAPGAGARDARERLLEQAGAAMEGWGK